MLPTLLLSKTALAAPEPGPCTLVQGAHSGTPLLFLAAGNKINVLSTTWDLLDSLPFELAFPIHSSLTSTSNGSIQALAFDRISGRLAACSDGRVAIWEANASSWRVHSSFVVNHSVTALDYAQSRIVAAGSSISVWELDESQAWPSWIKIGTEISRSPALSVRLSPSAKILASVPTGSSIVRLSDVLPFSSKSANAVQLRCHAAHAVPLRSVSWRPTDDPSHSGPILFITTLQNTLHIWGCMIDEPNFFSLWATIDLGTPALSHCFLGTKEMYDGPEWEGGGKRGTRDEWIGVASDGSVYLNTVSNFDCRPPTCLSQTTKTLHLAGHIPQHQLANLRHTFLLPSNPSPQNSSSSAISLIGRCSRGTIISSQIKLEIPSDTHVNGNQANEKSHDSVALTVIETNSIGVIQRLSTSICGEGLLVIGANGIAQGWTSSDVNGIEVESLYVSEGLGCQVGEGENIATWDQGSMIVNVNSKGLQIISHHPSSKRLRLLTSYSSTIPFLTSLYIAASSLASHRIAIIGVTTDFNVRSWIYDSLLQKIAAGVTHDLSSSSRITGGKICKVVPVSPSQATSSVNASTTRLLVLDIEGRFSIWSAELELMEWKEGTSAATGFKEVVHIACNSEMITAIVSKDGHKMQLSVWDSKQSEFTSGEQFSREISADVMDIKWSFEGQILAVATPEHVTLYCAQRIDDLSGQPSWIAFAEISLSHLTSSPISAISWLGPSLAIASDRQVFFYSPSLDNGRDCHEFADSKIAPLPYHHPQLLFQSLLHGQTKVVVRILAGLAAQLTEDGDVTPIVGSGNVVHKIKVDDFLLEDDRPPTPDPTGRADIFSALTEAAIRERQVMSTSIFPFCYIRTDLSYAVLFRGDHSLLAEDDERRLLSAIKKCSMKGLSKIEHAHLAVLVQTVYEIQRHQGSLDSNGLCYLISMRSFFIYNAAFFSPTSSQSKPSDSVVIPRLKYRDVVWAFHSESQEVLLEASLKACPSNLYWENVKALGLVMWIKSPDIFATQMEAIGRNEYTKNPETRDPISASLFHLALRKKHIVLTFWRQAGGHDDQRSMLKFLVNDFELPRWKTAALKNAYALLSKRRFLFAAVFFLLGDSLKDAVNIILRQLDDFQLALAITRAYEGDRVLGPVLKSILEDNVLPFAFRVGYRWLASWAFWKLGRRDLGVQVIVTPLADLASRIPYSLPLIGSPSHEDPCLVLLFAQLRSYSLQTVKGAIAVPGKTEFNFVLHMARTLCRMGCHVLALRLIRSWSFYQPARARRPSLLARPSHRHSLRRTSTKLDLEIPSSNIGSRAPSPDPTGDGAVEEFKSVLKGVRKEMKSVPEFDMGTFGF